MNGRFGKGKWDIGRKGIKRIKRKWCPDEFERVFCPLIHTQSRRANPVTVGLLSGTARLIRSYYMHKATENLPGSSCLSDRTSTTPTLNSITKDPSVPYFLHIRQSPSHLPPHCYTQNPALHIHNIHFNMFLKSTVHLTECLNFAGFPSTIINYVPQNTSQPNDWPVLHLRQGYKPIF